MVHRHMQQQVQEGDSRANCTYAACKKVLVRIHVQPSQVICIVNKSIGSRAVDNSWKYESVFVHFQEVITVSCNNRYDKHAQTNLLSERICLSFQFSFCSKKLKCGKKLLHISYM